jgi:uncharacterized OB-fold protein
MAGTKANSKTMEIPIAEGLFVETADGPRLIASLCSCGACYFPKAARCNNPDCTDRNPIEHLLGPKGVLWSYTVQHYPPPPPAKFDEPFVPYAIGRVEFPEGLRVLGRMSTSDISALKIGESVRVVLEKLYQDEHGVEFTTWMFRPSAEDPGSDQ